MLTGWRLRPASSTFDTVIGDMPAVAARSLVVARAFRTRTFFYCHPVESHRLSNHNVNLDCGTVSQEMCQKHCEPTHHFRQRASLIILNHMGYPVGGISP